MIDSLEVDEDGYPSEEALERIRGLKDAGVWELYEFIMEDFASLAGELRMGSVKCWWFVEELTDKRIYRIEFRTGGWSGCEDFIDAVLSVSMIRMCWYAEWKRGGLHVFEVAPFRVEFEESPPDRLTVFARMTAVVVFGTLGYLTGASRRLMERVRHWWHDHLSGL